MFRRNLNKPSPAMIVGMLALAVALGGTSYAAIVLPANSVGSKQIKKRAVKNSDLGRSAVTSGKVKNGSLLSLDFKAGQLPAGAQGLQGTQGLKGDKGDPGINGTNGTNGTNGATNVTLRSTTVPVAGGTRGQATAVCEPGERATGGGAFIFSPNEQTLLVYSHPGTAEDIVAPTGTPNQWRASVYNSDTETRDFRVWAICSAP